MANYLKRDLECSRCKKPFAGFKDDYLSITLGYYEVAEGYWKDFANEGETVICDPCMLADYRYIAVYGNPDGC